MKNQKIILASGSPRRIEMMRSNGIEPIIIPPEVSEDLPENISPEHAVMFLALKKALAVERQVLKDGNAGNLIIAADTIVYYDENIIGKPQNKQEAFDILKKLCGNKHFVATGVALLKSGTSEKEVFCEITEVFFKEYSDEEIIAYVDTDEPYDKAGGYAIQGTFGKYVDHIEGDYHNVIGFPWSKIKEKLKIASPELFDIVN